MRRAAVTFWVRMMAQSSEYGVHSAGTGTSGNGWSWMGTAIGEHAPSDRAIPIRNDRTVTRGIVSADPRAALYPSVRGPATAPRDDDRVSSHIGPRRAASPAHLARPPRRPRPRPRRRRAARGRARRRGSTGRGGTRGLAGRLRARPRAAPAPPLPSPRATGPRRPLAGRPDP